VLGTPLIRGSVSIMLDNGRTRRGILLDASSCGLYLPPLMWATQLPSLGPLQKPEREVEVVLLPPSEDGAFPGLKPVERSRGGAPIDDLASEGEIAGADIERIGAHLFVLFPFVNPGLALDAFFPSIPSSSRLVFENPYAPKAAKAEPRRGGGGTGGHGRTGAAATRAAAARAEPFPERQVRRCSSRRGSRARERS